MVEEDKKLPDTQIIQSNGDKKEMPAWATLLDRDDRNYDPYTDKDNPLYKGKGGRS